MDEHSNEWTLWHWHPLHVYINGNTMWFKTYCDIAANVCEYNIFLV
jgi:hypothetical protein